MIQIFAKTLIQFLTLSSLALFAFSSFASASPVVRQASGANAAAIQATIDLFRADLGGVNNGVGGSFQFGRREINWDGVPDQFAEPNNLPVDFFNNNSPRGIMINSIEDATGSALNQFAVSATAASGVGVRFGNINSTYPSILQTFSSQRLFIARNTHMMEVTFFIPGTSIPAAVKGFGVVFADVDSSTGGNRSLIRVYGPDGRQLSAASAGAANNGLSFVGISFNAGERIARVMIESGNAALSSTNDDGENGIDIVAMDDFIYGEPQSIDFASSVSGAVVYGTTPAGHPAKFVSGAQLAANGDSAAVAVSDSTGSYLFNENLETGGAYSITASKTGNVNGVTAFDATLVLRCVSAGANCTLSNIQRKSADADNDSSVTAFDATQILRFVSANGANANTGQTGKWKFDPPNRNYEALNSSISDENFTAFLVGDIDGDWIAPDFLAENAKAEQQKRETAISINAEDSSVITSAFVIEPERQQTELTEKADTGTETTANLEKPDVVKDAEAILSLPENAFAAHGSIVTIPIYLTNSANKKISSYNFAVLFDPNVLQPESTATETSNSLSGKGFTIVSDTSPAGRIGIAASALDNSITASGTLLYLRFRIIGSTNGLSQTSTGLSFEMTKKGNNTGIFEEYSGNRVSLSTANGSFSVAAAKPKV
ncbi:MAG: cohesin domain-containing protein [Acidobacteriota bacterium]|nr:cohesin domain-containing protein [Acidobacteriota bacterium]